MNEKNTPIKGLECIFKTFGYITYPIGKNIFLSWLN